VQWMSSTKWLKPTITKLYKHLRDSQLGEMEKVSRKGEDWS
jgi:hypothetical protein